MTPEQLVPLALALSPAIERYTAAEPPACPGWAADPRIEAWAAEVATLADVSDPALALAGLRAVRWLQLYRADVERQRRACDALGIDHAAAIAGYLAGRFPLVAVSMWRQRRPADAPRLDLLERRWDAERAVADPAKVEQLQAADDGYLEALAASGDLAQTEAAVRWGRPHVFDRALERRPWVWPWERAAAEQLRAVYPHDWQPEWHDRYGRGGDVEPGRCLVVDAEHVAPARPASQPRREPAERGYRRPPLRAVEDPPAEPPVLRRVTLADDVIAKASGSGAYE